ncbi:UDP-glucuronosyl/UDP-glucosyltransferase [Corchorus olitorius]|uniref:UDP-glucuronosyl/UDP-glucosyltransferase n=1 Tax=Corchorus olitorius TaxID=93759 RepID=A0A1R3K5Q0_9ROSI|nr:UDP-glucuronosyl/UDP-glucosyltransferase [Corchorus olitorius]
MNSINVTCHIVAMPSPGRGHINPMMNLCKSIASKCDNILITFVVTEEWLGLIGSDPKPDTIRFQTIPNVLPSERIRAANLMEFAEAIWTKMEAPFECVLDQLNPPPTLIMADTFLFWAVTVGNRRNIPVASFWPMPASMFSVYHHFHLFEENGHFPVDLLEKGDERVDYIPGVSSICLTDLDLPKANEGTHSYFLKQILNCISMVRKANFLLFPSIYELENDVVDTLKAEFPFPVYTIGPAIPYLELGNNIPTSSHGDDNNEVNYLKWLDRQPRSSVLYVSLGSFLSVSSAQMDEFAAGLKNSGVRFLWVVRNETCRMKEACGDHGFVVPWCDQLRVLCHSSVGGFWSHCGWNSTREGIFGGVPFLTFPLVGDQKMNSKLIVEDWKIGWRVKKNLSKKFSSAMNSISSLERPTAPCHLVALPYPGRGHINPMFNVCKFIASKSNDIIITFVLTEEWLGFFDSDPKPDTMRFCSIPNVLPPAMTRAANLFGFFEAVWTKMDAPFQRLLDQLDPPPTLIMADTLLFWAVSAGNQRNIPVASFWTISAPIFSMFHHFHLFKENGHFPVDPLAHFLLFPAIYELEKEAVDALKAEFPFPIYNLGPAIPYLELGDNNELNYLKWLDRQPRSSVLYVSLGSFLSVSSAQMDEIAAGLKDSGVRFLWVVRDETSRMKEACGH